MQIGHTSTSISIFPSDRLLREKGWKEGGGGTRSSASIEQRCSCNLSVFGLFYWVYCFFFFFYLFFFFIGEVEDFDLFCRSCHEIV